MTAITFDNFKDFIGKKVEVIITSYWGGLMYPDNNVLIGMNSGNYYFVSDQGSPDEEWWHWTIDTTSSDPKDAWHIEVYDYDEYTKAYQDELDKTIEHYEKDKGK